MKFTQKEITDKVKDFISERDHMPKSQIHLESSLKHDLNINSLDMVEIQVDIEKHFHIHLLDKDLEKLVTVQDIVSLIESELKKYNQ